LCSTGRRTAGGCTAATAEAEAAERSVGECQWQPGLNWHRTDGSRHGRRGGRSHSGCHRRTSLTVVAASLLVLAPKQASSWAAGTAARRGCNCRAVESTAQATIMIVPTITTTRHDAVRCAWCRDGAPPRQPPSGPGQAERTEVQTDSAQLSRPGYK
jgi:hypothetical protein